MDGTNGGVSATNGSMGELADRGGTPGTSQGDVNVVTGPAPFGGGGEGRPDMTGPISQTGGAK